MNQIRLISTNIFIAFLSIIFGLSFVEILLAFQPKNQTNLNTEERYIRLELFPPNMRRQVVPSNAYLKQTDSFNDKKKYYIQSDKSGAIVNPNDKNTFHNNKKLDIIFLGGSTTENMYVREDIRFPALVTKILNEQKFCKDRSCNILNAGTSGRTIPGSINILLNRYQIPKPKKVILMHNINDLVFLLRGNQNWSSDRHLVNVTKYPLMKLKTYITQFAYNFPNSYALFINTYNKFGFSNEFSEADKSSPLDKVPINQEEFIKNEFIKSLDIFISICQIQGIEPILMTQPSRLQDYTISQKFIKSVPGLNYKNVVLLHNKFNNIIKSYESKGILIIDLDNLIISNKENMFDLFHLTEKGNILAAEAIVKELQK